MKLVFKLVILFSITGFTLNSCSSLGKIAIQVAVPPKNVISAEIQSIAILNRSMTPDFINLKHDTLYYFKDKLYFNRSFSDSIAADTTIKVAAKAIFDSQRFDVVIPLDRNIYREDNKSMLEPMDTVTINELCKDFKVDAVLVLEKFSEEVTRDISVFPSTLRFYKGVIDLTYNSTWRFYQPHQSPPYLSFVVHDAIFWESPGYCYTMNEMYNKLPMIKDALIGGGLATGMDMADKISPRWIDVTRYYYITGNKEIDSAIPLIKMNNWEEAADIWMKYSSESDKSLRSKVEYNLALASEMKGDIEGANEWGGKSLKSKYSRNADNYLMNLGRRSLNQSRYYYTTGNPKIDAAVSWIKQHKWDEAAEIWMKYYSVNDKILQSKIGYNLALTEEMKGNIDLALNWGAKSLESNNSLSTKQYLRELRQLSRLRRTLSNPWKTGPSMIPWTLEGRMGHQIIENQQFIEN